MQKTILFLIFIFSINQTYAAEGKFEAFQRIAEKHQIEVKKEGSAYMIGGGLGLGISVALGITSEDNLPKLGYSLIQLLSAGAITYGAMEYFYGDSLLKQASDLKELQNNLEKLKVDKATSQKILEETTNQILRSEMDRFKKIKRIRGYMELTSAVTAGATLAFSKNKGSASDAALGFILLISTVGAYVDLTEKGLPKTISELYTFEVLPTDGGFRFQLAKNFNW